MSFGWNIVIDMDGVIDVFNSKYERLVSRICVERILSGSALQVTLIIMVILLDFIHTVGILSLCWLSIIKFVVVTIDTRLYTLSYIHTVENVVTECVGFNVPLDT